MQLPIVYQGMSMLRMVFNKLTGTCVTITTKPRFTATTIRTNGVETSCLRMTIIFTNTFINILKKFNAITNCLPRNEYVENGI